VIAVLAVTAWCPAAGADEAAASHGAWLGISARGLSDSWREREEYWSGGVMVTEVAPGSPANLAGVEAGDVLVSVDSRTLHNPADLADVVSGLEPGNTVPAIVARAGGRMIKVLDLTPGRVPGAAPDAALPPSAAATPATALTSPAAAGAGADATGNGTVAAMAPGEASAAIAVTAAAGSGAQEAAVVPPTPADARRTSAVVLGVRSMGLTLDEAISLGIRQGDGVMVRGVSADSPADRAGILPGDILSWVGNQHITDVDALDQAVAKATSPVTIVTLRRGVTRHVTAEFDPQAATAAAPATTAAVSGAATTAAAAASAAVPPAASAPSVVHAGDAEVVVLKDEVRTLREEVQKLREELAALTRQKP
jgi:membrane-associated protease RseP (regulator of RpoE activity)